MAHLTGNRLAGLAIGVLTAASTISGVALAQDELEAVVITGSRIANPNATSSSPILSVTSENIKLQGIVDAGDLVDSLPQHIQTGVDLSNQNNPLSNPGGITTMNLRGLGPQRTLVLVDGRRLGVGDPNSGNPNPSPDINQIPSALIERVEVVTGGASAVYGSDAIAGVVNFVMKRDFEGVQFDAQYGFNWHENHANFMQGLLDVDPRGLDYPTGSSTDGQELALSLTVGGNFADGRGNATGYLSYIDADPVTLAERDFAACQLQAATRPNQTPRCAGSANSNYFEVIGGSLFAVDGNQLVPWGNPTTVPPARFNSNPYMNLKHGRERYQAGVFAKYEWSERATLYTDFMFMQDKSNTAVAPSGLFIGSPIPVFCNNPLMSAQQRTAIGCTAQMITDGDTVDMLIGRRNVEGGPRMFGQDHTNYRAMVGIKGDINETWSYDVYGSYYDTDLFNSNEGYISIARSRAGLNGCLADGDGTLVPGCVPYNIWTEGGVTQAATDYIFAYGLANGSAGQEIASASMTGDLGNYGMQLPSAEEGVGVAFGAEYRIDRFAFLPDQTLGSGDLSGSGGASPTIDSDTNVTEMFVEFRVPLVQGKTGARDLTFETGYRYSDYELSGGVDTYKFGLQWSPVEDVRLRASFNHAIRAPSLIELFNPQTVTNTSIFSVDPCAGASPTATLAQCQRTGMTAAQYGFTPQCPAAQCSVLLGGNENLDPEVADTMSVGFTLTPSALPDFSLSVDWYEIEVEDIIASIPLNTSFDGCLNGTNLAYCANVVRTPFGTLFGDTIAGGGFIVGTNANVAMATFAGVDIQGSYRFDIGRFGSLAATLNAVKIMDTKTLPLPGEHEYDCAGLYGNFCGPAVPDWRHTLRLSWQSPMDIQASLQWRYISSVTHEGNTDDPTLGGFPVVLGGKLGARSYLDLTGTWDISEQYTVRVGINNVLDQDPPLVDTDISGPGTPNTWGPYDTLGRQVFFALTGRF